MDRNFFLAIFLSVLVYVGWFTFLNKRYGPPPPPPPGAPYAASADGSEKGRPPARKAQSALAPAEPAREERRGGLDGALSYEVQDLELKIQPLGGAVVSYDYPGPLGRVELVQDPYPGFFSTWPELKFERVGRDDRWPVLEARHPSGAVIRKEFIFRERDSLHTLRLTFSNPGRAPATIEPWALRLGPGIGLPEKDRQWSAIALLEPPAGRKSPRLETYKLKEEPEVHSEPWEWIGLQTHFFLAAVFPPEKSFTGFASGTSPQEALTTSWTGSKKKTVNLAPWVAAQAQGLTLQPGEKATIEVPFYFGPKSFTLLRSLGHGLERAVDFGWFHRLGRFALKILHVFHDWTGNWGWAIVLLTMLLQVVLFPLTYKSQKSMVLMKKVQPELARVQQKFKSDPRRMQAEMMELYKKHGVNPLGGCLPLLAQMPIFVALFNMLRNAWELHGAPWMLWVHDLSSPDPFYVLPVVMGGVMFLQSKLNPQAAGMDPAQAKMMQYLPLIFTFMFLNFPSGLVLYWLTNSILGFGQQLAIKRRLGA